MRTAPIIVVSALCASPATAGARARAALEITYTPDAERPVGFGLSMDVVAETRDQVDLSPVPPPLKTSFDPEVYAGAGLRFDLFTDGSAQVIFEPILGTAILQTNRGWCERFSPNLMVDARPGLAVRTRGGPAFTFAGNLEGAPAGWDIAARTRVGGALALSSDPKREARAASGHLQDLAVSVGLGPVLPSGSCSGVIVGRPLRDEEAIVLPEAGQRAHNPCAQEWLEQAREEHAAVAAFLRLAAELELVGAPSDLVRECRAAARDEREHALLCLQRAADHEGETLHLSGLRTTVRDFAHRREALETLTSESWMDGAINEGLAALEALARSADATCILDKQVHDRIAIEEHGHSELGARIAMWCAEELAAS